MMRGVETFVIRIWVPESRDGGDSPSAPESLRGISTHIASGQTTPFQGTDQLLRLILDVTERRRGRRGGAAEILARAETLVSEEAERS